MQTQAEPRFKKRLPCRVRAGQSTYSGMVLNLSRNGLFVQSSAGVSPGDGIRLHVRLDGSDGPVPIDAQVVWKRVVAPHLRAVASGGFGLRIRSAPEPWFTLLQRLSRGEESPAATRQAPTPGGSARPAASGRPLGPYRVRLQQQGGPRSRVVPVQAESEEDARRRALRSVGTGWTVLETERA